MSTSTVITQRIKREEKRALVKPDRKVQPSWPSSPCVIISNKCHDAFFLEGAAVIGGVALIEKKNNGKSVSVLAFVLFAKF
jgi:hypothetical protein